MTKEDARKRCETKARSLRNAAQKIRLIKEIVKQFDNKVYNCRFDEAVRALSDDTDIYYCTNRYNSFEIIYSERHSPFSVSLLSGYAPIKGEPNKNIHQNRIIFTPTKRIMAEKMIERMNERYAELLKEATTLENSLAKVDEVLAKTQELKRLYNIMVADLPFDIKDSFGLEYCWR